MNIKICCTSYSLRDYFSKRNITLSDFLEICSELNIEGVELHNMHFPETSKKYLSELEEKVESLALKIASIGASNNFAVSDPRQLTEQVNHLKKWIEVASRLESPVVRAFCGQTTGPIDYEAALRRTIACFRSCAHHAAEHGILIGIENHGNFCNNASEMLQIIEDVGSPALGTAPDTGNFVKLRYQQLTQIAPYAVHVHAKTYEFNARGEETTIDYRRVAEIFESTGYERYFSIEYEGSDDQMIGVKKSVALLRSL